MLTAGDAAAVRSASGLAFWLETARTATVTAWLPAWVVEAGVKRKPLSASRARAKRAATRGSAAAGVNEPIPPRTLSDTGRFRIARVRSDEAPIAGTAKAATA